MFASTPLPGGGEKRQKESDQWLSSDGDWSWSLESFGVVRDGIFGNGVSVRFAAVERERGLWEPTSDLGEARRDKQQQ